ncbi:MAG: AgmX/PglI C-terminal domain-containing protein [Deltaproteobacteria bacterium]|nr:AgmX/PglI C-terminal domain-containing protein [Deltaproteobacteria bacterium]
MSKTNHGAAGAMTRAMTAATQTTARRKVLRVGLIEGAAITEERVFDGQHTVTIGADSGATFTVESKHDTASVVLFRPLRDGRWELVLNDSLSGRVLLDGSLQTVESLRTQGLRAVALHDNTRGRLLFEGCAVLFQFVDALPVAPRSQLPSAIKRNALSDLDWTYSACLAGFLTLAFSGMGYVEFGYDPIASELFDLQAEVRRVQLAAAPAAEPGPPPVNNNEQAAEAPQGPTAPGRTAARRYGPPYPSAGRPASHSASTTNTAAVQAERAADAALRALANSSEFQSLVNATQTGHGSALARIANGQGLMTGSTEALQNVTGITNNERNGGVRRTGLLASTGPAGQRLGISATAQNHGNEIGTSDTPREERVITTRVSMGSIETDVPSGPEMPTDEIARVFRQNLSAIRSCYTMGLRNNPSLQGRVSIVFSVGTSGRVLGAVAVSGLTNGDDVHQCIGNRVQRYVFPQLRERVEVGFPVVLIPGQ